MSGMFTESTSLFALEAETGRERWTYLAKDSIRHNAIAIGNGRVFLIDRPLAQGDRLARRGAPPQEPAEQPAGTLIALDAATGELAWRCDEDVFGTLIDPLGITEHLARHVDGPEQAAELARAWRTAQLEFSWRLTLMGEFHDFEWVTAQALEYVAGAAGLDLDRDGVREELLGAYGKLELYPDAIETLAELQRSGFEMAIFSNGSEAMLERVIEANSLHPYFEQIKQSICTKMRKVYFI